MNVMITGASKGIGAALANEFASHGHNLILVARNAELLDAEKTRLSQKYPIDVSCFALDLTRPEDMISLKAIMDQSNVDVLVNNVGMGYLGAFDNMPDDVIHEMITLNISVLVELTKYFLKSRTGSKSRYILQVASTAAFQPGPMMALYYASKAFVVSFSRAIAYENLGKGVYVSILCPGPTDTAFFEKSHMQSTKIGHGLFGMASAASVAKIGYHGLMKHKLMIIPGFFNKLVAFLARNSPSYLSERIAYFLHR